MTKQIDLRKELKHLYAPTARRVEVVDVPAFNFTMIDGRMQPGESPESSPAFRDAMMALYGVSFTLKFMSKLRKSNPIDYGVMAVEGLWGTDWGIHVAPGRRNSRPSCGSRSRRSSSGAALFSGD